MQQQHVIVTGGSNGIGRAIALHLHAGGYAISVLDVDETGERDAEAHERWSFIRCDVSDEREVRSAIATCVEAAGSLNVLINNAGIANPSSAPLEALPLDSWNRVIGVNLTGAFLCSKHAVRHLKRANGVILNIASTRAYMSEPDTEAYAASKGGIVALTHAMAVSLGPDVRVNCISPGWIDTSESELRPVDHEQHPTGRVGRPGDIAALVDYLIGPGATFITGQDFIVDGGMTRKMIYEK